MPCKDATYCLTIQRSQPFTRDEITFLQLFLKLAESKNVYQDIDEVFSRDSINSLATQAISETLGLGNISYQVIYNMINWSQQTYEGQNISMCIGIEESDLSSTDGRTHKIPFFKIAHEDFFKVLSNGYDTMIVLNKEGDFYALTTLVENNNEKVYAPFRFSKVAQWTSSNSNVAFVLNRNGEILIFKKGELTFARRNGKWFFYSHNQAIRQLSSGTGKIFSHETREAIYLTALDVAFTRTGGCIGFIRKKHIGNFNKDEILSSENNFNAPEQDTKTDTLKSVVSKKKFYEIPRLLRMELVSVDGATIVSHDQKLISVGAILRLHGNDISSTGGGRTLAAMTLGKYGLGIKISNDGYIKVYSDSSEPILQIN